MGMPADTKPDHFSLEKRSPGEMRIVFPPEFGSLMPFVTCSACHSPFSSSTRSSENPRDRGQLLSMVAVVALLVLLGTVKHRMFAGAQGRETIGNREIVLKTIAEIGVLSSRSRKGVEHIGVVRPLTLVVRPGQP